MKVVELKNNIETVIGEYYSLQAAGLRLWKRAEQLKASGWIQVYKLENNYVLKKEEDVICLMIV